MSNLLKFLTIAVMAMLLTILYGLVHDQITIRISLEYFTIGHPKIVETVDPTLLALAWGVVATWWAGFFIGLLLGAASRFGSWPKVEPSELLLPITFALIATGLIALMFGLGGSLAASNGALTLGEPMASRVDPAEHVGYLTAWWTHNGGYVGGFLGGIVLVARSLHIRRRRARAYPDTTTSPTT